MQAPDTFLIRGIDLSVAARIVDFVLAVLATILSVLAIRFAWIQKNDAKETLRLTREALQKIDDAAKTIDETAQELPTKYIGGFPGNIEAIISLISNAQEKIDIMTDFSGYGSYSEPELFSRYQEAIRVAVERRSNIEIRWIIYEPALRQAILRKQFREADFTRQNFEMPADKALEKFMKKMKARGIKITDHASFIRANLIDEMSFIEYFKSIPRLDCYEISVPVPMFVWVIDGRECIFSFESEPEERTFFSFQTRDGRLVDYVNVYLNNVLKEARSFEN